MPFDPKLVQQAEAPLTDAGELQLPDDLLELATQLGDDAQHLAKLYPAVGRASQPGLDGLGRPSYEHQSIGLLSAVSVAEKRGGERETGRQGEKEVAHLRLTSRRLMRAVALVASLAAVTVGVAVWYPRDNASDHEPRNIAVVPDITTTTTEPANTLEPIALSPSPPLPLSPAPAPPPPAPPPPASRETFLHEYSGPELEGIYDLIGDAEDDTISI